MMATPFTLIFLVSAICLAVQHRDASWLVPISVAVVVEIVMALVRGYARDGVG